MAIAASSEAARAGRKFFIANGVPIHVTTFIGVDVATRGGADDPAPGDPVPMAFLVEQPPGSVVQSHFHQADQFQVVVHGGGTLGRHPVEKLSIHYANAFNAYGPIKAGAQGVHYFTLRNGYDPGAQYLPEQREMIRAAPREFLHATEQVTQATVQELALLEAPRSDIVLPMNEQGMAAWRHRLPPGATLRGADPAQGAGQYWVVTAGSARQADGAELPTLSTIFVRSGDAAMNIVAGAMGLEMLVLQYRRRLPAAA